MHSDDAYVPGFGYWIAALILALVIPSLFPGTDLPGNGLQWSTEYHEQ
ncbi:MULTISPECIES: hypothetical protein [unclassified Achromobacter]|nr:MULTISPECIES: hypothetical protein [unclassified Achromobacter]